MNAPPAKRIIEDVALELNITPAFVEKDWYVTQIVQLIQKFSFGDFTMIFSGGTALSKAHRLLHRFSEDIDFRIIAPGFAAYSKSKQRAKLSELKNSLFSYFKTYFPALTAQQLKAQDDNRFFAIDLNYPSQFDRSDALRPHILIEFKLSNLSLPAIVCSVSSFVAELSGNSPEVAEIRCIDPVENASDKLSAFIWRCAERDRGGAHDDPAIVRHLHDLSILSPLAKQRAEFREMVLSGMQQDDQRSVQLAGLTAPGKFAKALAILQGDNNYEKEYRQFVQAMSYAATSEMPGFGAAVESLHSLIAYVLKE